MSFRVLEKHVSQSEDVFKALSSGTRCKILVLLAEQSMNINELGQALNVAHPTVSKHIQILERAGLVQSEYMSGDQGTQKKCRLAYDRLMFSLEGVQANEFQVEEIEMPIGMFSKSEAHPTCGLVSRDRVIGLFDEPQAFLLPERSQAQLIWMANGFLEYVFPNTVPMTMEIQRLELSMEACSECADYNIDYPSDISVWINGVEIGRWTSPGDLGGKRGRLNPPEWSDQRTQYGLLKVWSIERDGSYVDGLQVSDVTLAQTKITPYQPITVRIGIAPDAVHKGGFNLFGRGYGNYEQDLILRLHYHPK